MNPNPTDKDPLAHFAVVRTAVGALRLPLMDQRKLNGIMNAIEMQLESDHYSPEAMDYLLRALQAAVLHEVSDGRETAVVQAINTFAEGNLEQLRPATDPIHDFNALLESGYVQLEEGETITAVCDTWLASWELAKQLITPDIKTDTAFDIAYPDLPYNITDWLSELEMELHNAGIDDPIYHQHRVQFARDYLDKFPETPTSGYITFRRAEAEGLWYSGKREESEAVYRALVEQLPTEGWVYIGWSDMYHWDRQEKPDYARAEEILLRALQQPGLIDKKHVLGRLQSIYTDWDKPEKQAALENTYDKRQLNLTEPSKIKQISRFFKKQTDHTKKNKRKKRH